MYSRKYCSQNTCLDMLSNNASKNSTALIKRREGRITGRHSGHCTLYKAGCSVSGTQQGSVYASPLLGKHRS